MEKEACEFFRKKGKSPYAGGHVTTDIDWCSAKAFVVDHQLSGQMIGTPPCRHDDQGDCIIREDAKCSPNT